MSQNLAPIVRGDTALIEQPGSPHWDFTDEGADMVRTFQGTYQDCLDSRPIIGAECAGEYFGLKIKSASVEQKGPNSKLEIRYSGALQKDGEPVPEAALPEDEFSVDMEKQVRGLLGHPRYKDLSSTQKDAIMAVIGTDPKEREWAWQYLEGVIEGQENIPHMELAYECAKKFQRGMESFVFFAPRIQWTTYSWTCPQGANAATYPEEPSAPIDLPTPADWLRLADTLSWTGKYWKLTRSWLGCIPFDGEGTDRDIYPIGLAPEGM